MDQCSLYCVNTKSDQTADVLERNDKRIKVAVVNTDITVVLMREDNRRPYIGYALGMEFETFGELDE
jgi:hypothetical protein